METNNNGFLYDAFISYRHTDLDKFVAVNLHKQLESFKPPKNILKNPGCTKKKINRVFRDQDELPLASNLEEPIVHALANSEFLIVICSPRLKESAWCMKEIDTFISIYGRERILAVLIEGEPHESFPPQLLYEDTYVTNHDGSVSTYRRQIEPLAADVRGKSKSEVAKKIKSEMLRLLAPMFNVTYDDLRQRHREQKVKKIVATVSIVAALGLLFGIYSTVTALLILGQKVRIEKQATMLSEKQAIYMAESADDLMDVDDRGEAIKTAVNALTVYDGVEMPATPEAERALVNATRIYDCGAIARPYSDLKADGIISDIKLSPNGYIALTVDEIGEITVWDLDKRERIFTKACSPYKGLYGFVDDEHIVVTDNDEKSVYKINIRTGEEEVYQPSDVGFVDTIFGINVSDDGKRIVVSYVDSYDIIDGETFECVYHGSGIKSLSFSGMHISSKSNLFVFENDNKVEGVDMYSFQKVFSIDTPDGYIYDAVENEDTVFIFSVDNYDLVSGNTIITAVDKKTGAIKYTGVYNNILAWDIKYSGDDTAKNILVYSESSAMLIDAETGKELKMYAIGSHIAAVEALAAGSFMVYTSDGVVHSLNGVPSYGDIALQAYGYHNVDKLIFTSIGPVGIRRNDNKMSFYAYMTNFDAVQCSGEGMEPKIVSTTDPNEMNEWCEKYMRERATFVHSYVEIPEINLTIVSLKNGEIEIYRCDNMEFIARYEDYGADALKYYGKVGAYYVVESSRYGLLIDENGGIHGTIEEFMGVSKDGSKIIVGGRDSNQKFGYFELPVYSTEELIDRANSIIERYY